MDRRQAPCPRAPAGPRRCQCLAGPIRPRNNPSARAFLGLPSPNSVALVDHWHRPASGTRGLTVQTNQPGGSSIVICLWPWCCLCFCFAPSLPPPPDPSAQLAPTNPNPTQPKLLCLVFTDYLSDPVQVSSPSPYPKYTLSSPPNVSSNH